MWVLPSSSFSPASADSASPCAGCGPLLAAWATSSGTPTLRPSSWRGWLTRPWSARLFGSETFATWTAAASRLGWTSSPQDSPVRTSALPVREPGSVEPEAGCGLKSCESLRSSIRSSSSSKTWQPFAVLAEGTWTLPQASLFEPSASFSETWPQSGMTLSGQAFELQRPVRHTSGTDGSAWPTAQSADGKRSSTSMMGGNPTLLGATLLWSTATAECSESAEAHRGAPDTLTAAVSVYPTPAARDWKDNGTEESAKNRKSPCLPAIAAGMWPTATGGDAKGSKAVEYSTDSGRHSGVTLTDATSMWPTPTAIDEKCHETPAAFNRRQTRENRRGRKLPIEAQSYQPGPLDQPTAPDGPTSPSTGRGSRRRLNPRFVCWLMNFPIGWTEP